MHIQDGLISISLKGKCWIGSKARNNPMLEVQFNTSKSYNCREGIVHQDDEHDMKLRSHTHLPQVDSLNDLEASSFSTSSLVLLV